MCVLDKNVPTSEMPGNAQSMPAVLVCCYARVIIRDRPPFFSFLQLKVVRFSISFPKLQISGKLEVLSAVCDCECVCPYGDLQGRDYSVTK